MLTLTAPVFIFFAIFWFALLVTFFMQPEPHAATEIPDFQAKHQNDLNFSSYFNILIWSRSSVAKNNLPIRSHPWVRKSSAASTTNNFRNLKGLSMSLCKDWTRWSLDMLLFVCWGGQKFAKPNKFTKMKDSYKNLTRILDIVMSVKSTELTKAFK